MMFEMVLLAMEVFLIGNSFFEMLDFPMTLQIRAMISKTENDYQNWNCQTGTVQKPELFRVWDCRSETGQN